MRDSFLFAKLVFFIAEIGKGKILFRFLCVDTVGELLHLSNRNW